MPSTLRLDQADAVAHLAEWTGNGTWRSRCNVLDRARYDQSWEGWVARTHTSNARRVVLDWNDTENRRICQRCVRSWYGEMLAIAHLLNERHAMPMPRFWADLAVLLPDAHAEENGEGEVIVWTGLGVDDDGERLNEIEP